MAAGILGSPGDENGPCKSACEHKDFAQTRRMAAAKCKHCGEPIGYGVRFYNAQEDGFVHAICHERAVLGC